MVWSISDASNHFSFVRARKPLSRRLVCHRLSDLCFQFCFALFSCEGFEHSIFFREQDCRRELVDAAVGCGEFAIANHLLIGDAMIGAILRNMRENFVECPWLAKCDADERDIRIFISLLECGKIIHVAGAAIAPRSPEGNYYGLAIVIVQLTDSARRIPPFEVRCIDRRGETIHDFQSRDIRNRLLHGIYRIRLRLRR